ncbi:hypothetical protein QUA95_00755 [Microcoleus sp. F10_A2]|uniref:hypothetical protein n=1 Tax=unclassified Microcoleus TaxID=2642155 RepID=UPI002FD00D4E
MINESSLSPVHFGDCCCLDSCTDIQNFVGSSHCRWEIDIPEFVGSGLFLGFRTECLQAVELLVFA